MTPAPMRGVLMVLLAAVCWGTTGTAQSFAPISLSAFWLGALRLATAAVFFAAVLLLGRKTRGAWQLPWAAVALAGTSMAVYNLAFFAGVRATGVAVRTAVALGSDREELPPGVVDTGETRDEGVIAVDHDIDRDSDQDLRRDIEQVAITGTMVAMEMERKRTLADRLRGR